MATTLTERRSELATGEAYRQAIELLDVELRQLDEVFRGLSDEEWAMSTKLVPLDPNQKHWTVFELAGHFDISIGLARMLMADRKDGQPGRDRVSFFIFPRSEVAPVVYDYAYKMVEGKTPRDMPAVLHETFSKTIEQAKTTPPDHVGPGYYALMRADEFITSRVVEAVVHGIDLTDALGRDTIATPAGTALTARILDDLLARRTVAGRPEDLRDDDRAWVRAASGRGPHNDPRLPLIG
jgi:Mycothiol maleylpyruvate isomerase N-terminal domain